MQIFQVVVKTGTQKEEIARFTFAEKFAAKNKLQEVAAKMQKREEQNDSYEFFISEDLTLAELTKGEDEKHVQTVEIEAHKVL